MNEFTGNVRVADYPSDECGNLDLSAADVSEILGKNIVTMQFLKVSVTIDEVNITYDAINDKYIVDLVYTRLSHKTIDKDGNQSEILIGLTPFSEWSNYFGKDWSILYLAPDWFEYENDVAKDKLYGFFYVYVSQEQIKDFNSWFSGHTKDGCVTVFSQEKIQGSGFYKFMRGSAPLFAGAGAVAGLFFGHPIIGTAVGGFTWYTINSISEVINEDNGTYYSYFAYLDGTTNKSFDSRNKADNYNDHSSSFVNTAEDIGDYIRDGFSSIWNALEPFMTFIKVLLVILIVVLVGIPIVKFIGWVFPKNKRKNKK